MKQTTATNPFARPESSIFKAFEIAKKGTSRAALIAFCDRNKIGKARVLREIQSGQFKTFRWKVTRKESGDTVNIKVHSIVEIKAAAKAKAPVKAVKAPPKKKTKPAARKATKKAAKPTGVEKASRRLAA